MALAPGTTVEEAERRFHHDDPRAHARYKTRAAEIPGHQSQDAAQQVEQAAAASKRSGDNSGSTLRPRVPPQVRGSLAGARRRDVVISAGGSSCRRFPHFMAVVMGARRRGRPRRVSAGPCIGRACHTLSGVYPRASRRGDAMVVGNSGLRQFFPMRLGIKGKQVLGVTMIVGAVGRGAERDWPCETRRVSLDESHARAELLSSATRSFIALTKWTLAPAILSGAARRSGAAFHPRSRSLRQRRHLCPPSWTAMVCRRCQPIRRREQQPIHAAADLDELLSRSSFSKLTAIYRDQGRNLDYSTPLLLGDQPIGSVRIGVSTLLIRRDLNRSFRPRRDHRSRCARHRGLWRDDPRAVVAASHPRHPQRVDAPRQGREGRPARSGRR